MRKKLIKSTSKNSFRPLPLVGEGRVMGNKPNVFHPHPSLLPSREKVNSYYLEVPLNEFGKYFHLAGAMLAATGSNFRTVREYLGKV